MAKFLKSEGKAMTFVLVCAGKMSVEVALKVADVADAASADAAAAFAAALAVSALAAACSGL